MRYRSLLLIVLLMSIGLAVHAQDTLPRYEPLDECFIEMPEGINYDCGYVIVPEFHGEDTGNTISLGVVRLNTAAETPEAPLFMGAGGPGGTVMSFASRDAASAVEDEESFWAQVLQTRDVVYIAQRGTAYSVPELNCQAWDDTALNALLQPPTNDTRQALNDALQSCVDDFTATGRSLAAYNSVENAADFNSIREALGYDQIVYYGESYGTLLGQHIMRDYPDMLSMVILDGVSNISSTSWSSDLGVKYQYVLDAILAQCEADPECIEAYPNTAENINIVYNMLEEEPYVYELQEGLALYIGGVEFASAIYGSMYLPFGGRLIIQAINDYANGEDTEAVQAVMGRALPGSTKWLMHYSVTCAEDPPDRAQAFASIENTPYEIIPAFQEFQTDDYEQSCAIVDVPSLPDYTDDLVVSDLPVLLLHGELDPATPRFIGEAIVETLPNSYSFEFPLMAHVQITSGVDCAESIALDFLADPTTEPDASCLAD